MFRKAFGGERYGHPVPEPRYAAINFVVPGLFAVILMAFPPLLTALAVARERGHRL